MLHDLARYRYASETDGMVILCLTNWSLLVYWNNIRSLPDRATCRCLESTGRCQHILELAPRQVLWVDGMTGNRVLKTRCKFIHTPGCSSPLSTPQVGTIIVGSVTHGQRHARPSQPLNIAALWSVPPKYTACWRDRGTCARRTLGWASCVDTWKRVAGSRRQVRRLINFYASMEHESPS